MPARRNKNKSIDPKDVLERGQLLSIEHSNLLEVEVSHLSVELAAAKILEHISLLKTRVGY